MAGFPNRPTRSSFGPTMENAIPIRNPAKQLGADPVNLAFWQVAGAGRTLSMALIVYDGVDDEVDFQAMAFDPRGELAALAPTVNGTGDYTFTFATTYPDQRGVPAAFTPKAAFAFVQGVAGNTARAEVSGQDVNVETVNSAGTPVHAPFVLMVW